MVPVFSGTLGSCPARCCSMNPACSTRQQKVSCYCLTAGADTRLAASPLNARITCKGMCSRRSSSNGGRHGQPYSLDSCSSQCTWYVLWMLQDSSHSEREGLHLPAAVASALCPTPVTGLLHKASQNSRPCRDRLTAHPLNQRVQGGALGQPSHWSLPWRFLTLLWLLVVPPACTYPMCC